MLLATQQQRKALIILLKKYPAIDKKIEKDIQLITDFKTLEIKINSQGHEHFKANPIFTGSFPICFGAPKHFGNNADEFVKGIKEKDVGLVLNVMTKKEKDYENIINKKDKFKISKNDPENKDYPLTEYEYIENDDIYQEAPIFLHIDNLTENTLVDNSAETENFLKSIKDAYQIAKDKVTPKKPLLIHCRQGLQRTAAIAVLLTLLDQMVKDPTVAELSDEKLKNKILEYSTTVANMPKPENDMADRLMTPHLFYSLTTPQFLKELKKVALSLRA